MNSDRKSQPSDLSTGLPELFTRKNWSQLWNTYTLTRKWPEIAGKDIAKMCEPAYIQRDTLWVHVESSVLMQHLQQQKLSLVDKINSLLPEAGIRDVRWAMQPGRPDQEQPDPGPTGPRAPDPEEQEAFNALTETVENDECRRALQKLWQKFNSR